MLNKFNSANRMRIWNFDWTVNEITIIWLGESTYIVSFILTDFFPYLFCFRYMVALFIPSVPQ